jgi:hypothetical protein
VGGEVAVAGLSSRPSLRDEMGSSRYLIVLFILRCWTREYSELSRYPIPERDLIRMELNDGYKAQP